MAWETVNWEEFCAWISGRKVKTAVDGHDGETFIVFEDGSEAEVRSNYDGPYSEVTPGNGIEPPTVRVNKR